MKVLQYFKAMLPIIPTTAKLMLLVILRTIPNYCTVGKENETDEYYKSVYICCLSIISNLNVDCQR